MSIWGELRRRNVHRVAIGYVATAWLLIQVAETLFPVFGLSDGAVRAVVIVLAVGIVPAVITSWVFEWTPEGLRRDGKHSVAVPASHTRRFDAAIIAVLVIAVAYFAIDKFVLDPSRDAAQREAAREEGRADALVEAYGEKSLVVLPFVNLSSDPEQEYFGHGLAEELLNLLAQVEGLRVISRTSAFSFSDTKLTLAEIAELLNVRYVLEGSVRKSGNALRIAAQLVDARADTQVWSDTYQHSTADIFDIQDSVAREVIGHLTAELALDPPTTDRHDPAAYALYLQARQLSNRSNTKETRRELLERALVLEPDYLDAKVELAWVHRGNSLAAMWASDHEAAEWHDEQYRALLDDVFAQDPQHAGANATRAWQSLYDGDLPEAAHYAERALASEPAHFGALTTAGEIFSRLWRAEQAVRILRYASERDPVNPYHFENLAGAYLDAGRYESAEKAYRTHRVLAPDHSHWSVWGIGLALLLQEKAGDALQHFNEIGVETPLVWHGRALALYDLGRTDEAAVELARLVELDRGTPNIQWFIGSVYAWFGATDEAFDFFEMQREADPIFFTSMGESPLYANLHDDPRWQPFLASVNLDPEYLASITFEPRLPAEIRRRADLASK